jgi:hypothetical protein
MGERNFACVIILKTMNTLKAVFWDYPELTSPSELKGFMENHKTQPRIIHWLLRRFLENGRVVDVLNYFSTGEIAVHLPELRLSSYSRKKWERIIDVYGCAQGR